MLSTKLNQLFLVRLNLWQADVVVPTNAEALSKFREHQCANMLQHLVDVDRRNGSVGNARAPACDPPNLQPVRLLDDDLGVLAKLVRRQLRI